MFEKLEIFSMAHALAKHSAARQSAIAQNVANSDTPGYRARDVAEFSKTFRSASEGAMRSTRPAHSMRPDGAGNQFALTTVYRDGAAEPNGNTVSIEEEMFAATRAKSAHDRALAIYGSAMKILRTSVSGRG